MADRDVCKGERERKKEKRKTKKKKGVNYWRSTYRTKSLTEML